MVKLILGENDLATTHPELSAEWHPSRNGTITPNSVTKGSNKKVWWLGDCGHEWVATIAGRTHGRGCPYCAGQKILLGFNDLQTLYPEISAEWHPTKNGTLTPEQVAPGSNKKVWWKCKRGHEWEAVIASRVRGHDCPYCTGYCATPGETDLATTNPELTLEWHPTKNEGLLPTNVKRGSEIKVWWLGKCGHEWKAYINNRTRGMGCPICAHGKRTRTRHAHKK